MPPKTAEPPHAEVQPIVVPDTVKQKLLLETLKVFNEMVNAKLFGLFPEDLSAEVARAHLAGHVDAYGKVGDAREAESTAVETKQDLIKRAETMHTRVLGLVDASFPEGAVGRTDFFPGNNTNPNLGELLEALGKGIIKRNKPMLPPDLTAEGIVQLGKQASAALAVRKTKGDVHSGQTVSAEGFERRTREIRRRLRKLVSRFYGLTSDKLIPFGIKPRVFNGGRKRKVAEVAEIAEPEGKPKVG